MKNVFFIVGPTATGKSEIAADVARALDAEIVSADAFQIYRGLDLLSAKPNPDTVAKVPHHLIGTMSILLKMDAEKFRRVALEAIKQIQARGKPVIVVGGSGLYLKALTHGLGQDWQEVNSDLAGVFVSRERNELYERINQRVETMFARGVIEEIRASGEMGATASKMIGVREIREHLDGKMSILQCIAQIQQNTRNYAKRQLTWFRHQTSFEPLNLSLLTHSEAVTRISQRAQQLVRVKG